MTFLTNTLPLVRLHIISSRRTCRLLRTSGSITIASWVCQMPSQAGRGQRAPGRPWVCLCAPSQPQQRTHWETPGNCRRQHGRNAESQGREEQEEAGEEVAQLDRKRLRLWLAPGFLREYIHDSVHAFVR